MKEWFLPRNGAVVFNLANTLNLALGPLAGVSLGIQLWRRSQPVAKMEVKHQ